MKSKDYDDNDPFHTNAHLILGFVCVRCDGSLGPNDEPHGDLEEGFLDYCVAISDRAKNLGWICLDDFKFICPKCAVT